LKPPGIKHLKLKCDELFLSFAFKLNLRRYTKAGLGEMFSSGGAAPPVHEAGAYSRPLLSST
jgi:hypothetical protein